MDRRTFFVLAGAGFSVTEASAAAAAIPAGAAPKKTASAGAPLKARLGHQMNSTLSEANCKWASRYGLEAICAKPEIKDSERLYPTVEELNRMLDLGNKHKLKVEIIDSPLLQSTYIDREKHAAIMLGQSPERDREIEAIQTTLKNCAAVGIRTLKYNLSILGVPRNPESVPGRGDTTYGKWNLKEGLAANLPLTRAGRVNEEEYWRRIEYFLARVVPVANQYKVRIACHPEDPGMPPEGFQGIQNPLCAVSGLKKFVTLHESPYHGLNFCQGTVAEMLDDPRREIDDVIRWFGTRGKLFNVHFRNIKGRKLDFMEAFPDEGDMDMARSIRVYHEVGYPYMLMPDHVPQLDGRDPSGTAFAFCYGYIRGLLDALPDHADA